MKGKNLIKIILIIVSVLSLFIYTKTEAKTTCTTKEKNNLIQLAYNTKFDYELSDDKSSTQGLRFYEITLSNLIPEVYVEYNGFNYTYDATRTTPGVTTIMNLFQPSQTYSFKLYASDSTNCMDEYLVSKRVTTPAYNVYSELDECSLYPEFKLCNKNYSAKITDKQFETELEKYKASLIKIEQEKKENNKNTLIETITSTYINNLKISIPLSALLFVIVIIMVYKIIKSKKRAKIDL